MWIKTCSISLVLFLVTPFSNALLYPRDSETRDHRSLDGIWNFVLGPDSQYGHSYNEFWQLQDLKLFDNVVQMPVPSSYNDITQDKNIRDHVGVVWYDREFFVPATWNTSDNIRVWLRFGSVHYYAQVVSTYFNTR